MPPHNQKHVCEYDEQNRARFKKRLWAFFSKFDPEKLVSVSRRSNDDIISRTLLLPIFEDVCLSKTCSKYDVDPKEEEESARKAGLLPKNDDKQDDDFVMIDEPKNPTGGIRIEDEYGFANTSSKTNTKNQTETTPNSILNYSASDKSRLAKRLERFFTSLVSPSVLARQQQQDLAVAAAGGVGAESGGGNSRDDHYDIQRKVEKLLLGNVAEIDLIKRLCARYEVDEQNEIIEARAFSLFPKPQVQQQQQSSPLMEVQIASSTTTKRSSFNPSSLLEQPVEESKKKEEHKNQDEEEQEDEDEEEEDNESSFDEDEIEAEAVPVCGYFGANRDRFYRRVLCFYKLHQSKVSSSTNTKTKSTTPEQKAAAVLEMNETEITIFKKLRSRYNVTKDEERRFARKFEGYPEYVSCVTSCGGAVCIYNSQDTKRFKARAKNFYEKHTTTTPSKTVDEKKLNMMCTMHESEEDIFETLAKKYNCDLEVEKEESRKLGLLPDMENDDDEETEEEEEQNDDEFEEDEEDEEEPEEEENPLVDSQGFMKICHYSDLAKSRLRQRMVDFYEKFEPTPEALGPGGKVDRALETMQASENEVFAKLCTKYNVDLLDEQDQARFHGLLPVCAYDEEEKQRLKKRLFLFYKNYYKQGIAKIESILKMVNTEEQIFETLCTKYCDGKIRQEQAQALRHGLFPLEDQEDEIKKNAGTLQVKDYPLLEKKYRLRRRVELFYSIPKVAEKVENNNSSKVLQQKIDRVLLMENTEKEIFTTLCWKYEVHPKVERANAKAKFAHPKF